MGRPCYVEIELSNPDAETRVEVVGPFRTWDSATAYADSLGRTARLTQNNPDVPGFWTGAGEYVSGNGWAQETHVTVMVRPFLPPKARPAAKLIRDFLRGED